MTRERTESAPTPSPSGPTSELCRHGLDAFGSLRYPHFTSIWGATFFGNIGNTVQLMAASMAMMALGASPDIIALLQVATTAPIVMFALVAGTIADFWNHRGVMISAQLMGVLSACVLLFITQTESVSPSLLILAMFLMGCGTAFFQPAWHSSLSLLVSPRHLSSALSVDSFAVNAARMLGPIIGTLAVGLCGSSGAFTLNALTHAAVICSLLAWKPLLRSDDHKSTRWPSPPSRDRSKAAVRPHALRATLLRSVTFGFLGSPLWALLPVLAVFYFPDNPLAYGTLFAAFGGGAVIGAIGGAPMRARLGHETTVTACAVGAGLGMGVLSLTSSISAAAVLAVIIGASWVGAVSTLNNNAQNVSPPSLLGRSVALFHTAAVGGLAAGGYFWGVIATSYGLRSSLFIAGALMTCSIGLRTCFRLSEEGNPGALHHAEAPRPAACRLEVESPTQEEIQK